MSTIDTVFAQPVVQAFGWTLVHFVWQGAAVALVFAASLALLRRASSNARYAAACVALVVMAVSPAVTYVFVLPSPAASPIGPPISRILPAGDTFGIRGSKEPPIPIDKNLDVTPMPPFDSAATTAPVPMLETASSVVRGRIESYLPGCVLAWLLGVVVLSARLLVGWMRVEQITRRSVQPAAEYWQAALHRLARALRVSRPVRLLESALVEVPSVIGWLRPVVLLPAAAITGLTTSQLEALLCHELAHVRRHDYLVNLLQSVIETLLFYHPAVWWVSNRMRTEREVCCDELAVQCCGSRLAYARALAAMEEIRGTMPQLAIAASGGSLLARIRRLLGRTEPGPNRSAGWLVGTIVLAMFVTFGVCLRITAFASPRVGRDAAVAGSDDASSIGPDAPPFEQDSSAAATGDDPIAKLPGEIFVAAFVRTPPDNMITFKHIVIAVDPNTGKWRSLFDFALDGNTALYSTRVSPDGQSVLFMNKEEIWNCDTKLGLAPGRVSRQGHPRAWAPDSKHFLTAVFTGTDSEQRWAHWKVTADGSDQSAVPISPTDRVSDWSADGNWLVAECETDSELYVMRADGSERRKLTASRHNHFARFAPDSERIVYNHMAGGGAQAQQTLRVINVDGTDDHELLGERGVTAPSGACWSPDGKQLSVLLFDWGPGKVLFAGDEANYRLAIVDADGGNLRELQLEGAKTVAVQFDGPEWRVSPQGPEGVQAPPGSHAPATKSVLHTNGTRDGVAGVESASPQSDSDTTPRPAGGSQGRPQPPIRDNTLPNGSLPGRLVVAAGLITAQDDRRIFQTIIAIDPNTGSWTRLQNKTDGFTWPLSPVRVSPDGQTLLFMREKELWKCDARTGERADRMLERGSPATWSPDGRASIAIVPKNESDFQAIDNWLVSADGQEHSVLRLPDADAVEDWSPDGQWLAIWSRKDGQLYIAKPDGSGRRRLTDTGENSSRNEHARFSPDSRRIVYHCTLYTDEPGADASHVSLRTINVDGTGDREILGETKAGSEPDSTVRTAPKGARWSPDGKHLAVVLYDHTGDGGILAINGNWRLAIMDADGGSLHELKLEGVLIAVLPWDGPEWRP